jgi:opacity protein-like surface antigen
MKKILLVFAAVWITVSGNAQVTADIGIWGGSSVYFGDIDETNPLQPLNLNFGGYFRYNFNSRVGLRAMFLTGNFADEGFIEGVATTFSKSVQDFSLQIEINYLKYILGLEKTPFSSYVTAGIGVAYFPYNMDPALIASFNPIHNKGNEMVGESEIATTIPFGIGFKYTLGQRLGIGIEYQMRKLFSDKLDNLDDPLAYFVYNTDGSVKEEITYTDMTHNNDWSGYLGIHLTYKIYIGKRACPAYESKN